MTPARLLACSAAAGLMAISGITSALAAGVVVVTPANQQGWSTQDTRPGGTVTFVSDPTSHYPPGALQLTTDLTITAKAQYLHAANTPLANVHELSYYTKQVSAVFPGGDPSYQLIVCLTGPPTATTCPGFTTLVFEPYQNGVVVPGVWQFWDVAAGHFWSTRNVVCPHGALVAGNGGPPFYTLDEVKAMCPNAVAAGFGVNIGTNNPGYVVRTDGFNFNGTIYDFQVTNTPTSEEQCKHGGFVNFTDAQGKPFKNQGQCVAFVENHQDQNDDQGGQQGGGGDTGGGGDHAN